MRKGKAFYSSFEPELLHQHLASWPAIGGHEMNETGSPGLGETGGNNPG